MIESGFGLTRFPLSHFKLIIETVSGSRERFQIVHYHIE
jgi:hypothetical protein